MSIFSQFSQETAPALAAIEEDATKAIEAGRQWIAGMFARLNDFKTALEKDIADFEGVIKQAASDAEATIAGKKEALAKVNAEIATYSGLVPPPAQAPAQEPGTGTEPVTAEPQTTAETAEPAVQVEPAPVEPAVTTEPAPVVEPTEPAAPASEAVPADPAPAAPAA